MSYALSMNAGAQPGTPLVPSNGARLVATGGRALPLRHAHLEAKAGAGLCRVVLTQRYVNPHAEPLHVTYQLPLPSDAAVSGFSFTLGEVRIVGEVDTRDQARERFHQAMAQGRTAALLEQDRSSLFTQEVGNVPPGEEIVCEIIVDQPLRWLEEGAWEWRFPTVVGPRYMGGPGATPDGAKIVTSVASHGTGARSSLSLRIDDVRTGAVESSSHRVREADDEVRFESAKLDRDVVVRWPVSTDEVGERLRCARPAGEGHDGVTYGLLTLVPPTQPTARARDLTLLLDVSGSMHGRPLDQLKRVSLALLDTLGPEDRLELIAFGSRPERFRPEPIRASREGKAAARKWLKALSASGGTEMHAAVLEAVRPLRDDAQRQVVLMTDGFIGFESTIVRTLLEKLPAGARLHTVGVGSAPNRSLTEAAARAGRGAELIVGLEEDAERAAQRLLVRTSAPVVTDLVIEGASTAPRQLPDLFGGCPAQISLRAEPGAHLVVRGTSAEGAFERRFEVPALDLGEGPQEVVQRFGREHVEDLEMQLTATNDHSFDRAIEAAGLRFSITTRHTSWIAVTEEVTVKAPARHETMPHELPDGVSAEGLGLRPAVQVIAADAEAVTDLEGRLGRSFTADERAELEREMAESRTIGTRTQTGVLKSKLSDVLMELTEGGAADDEDAYADEPHEEESSAVLFNLRELALEEERVASDEPAPQAPAQASLSRPSVPEKRRRAAATPSMGAGGAPTGAPMAAPQSKQAEALPLRKRNFFWLWVLLFVALVVGVLTWWIASSSEPEPPAPPAETTEVTPGE